MKPILRLLPMAAVLLLAGAASLAARTFTSQTFPCQIDVPESSGWMVDTATAPVPKTDGKAASSSIVFKVIGTSGKAMVVTLVEENAGITEWSHATKESFLVGFLQPSVQLLDSSDMHVNGYPTFEIKFKETDGSAYGICDAVLVNDRVILIIRTSTHPHPESDTALTNLYGSLRFTDQKPVAAAGISTKHSSNSSKEEFDENPAFAIGYYMGMLLPVALIIGIIIFFVRRSSAKRARELAEQKQLDDDETSSL